MVSSTLGFFLSRPALRHDSASICLSSVYTTPSSASSNPFSRLVGSHEEIQAHLDRLDREHWARRLNLRHD